MASVVFILGAGASKQAGAPLMNEFLDVAYDLWKMGRVSDADEMRTPVLASLEENLRFARETMGTWRVADQELPLAGGGGQFVRRG